ncbi:DNA polymerase II [Methanoculleus chikugoensis]|uniref:DNA polymerase n=2 Tax=Methanoculleus chikugoensis TaxID=118126 RepID=A0A1M4MJM3_9EURY|nr:DNA-directed DNA polymerase [Methanoculleus chikugoensis]MDD4567579.1 DNA-directed DNA polymerase [Methanoculleus chikugoensis]SCL75057.1 DNA polymerase II [Methanoculleus chikugoensis]
MADRVLESGMSVATVLDDFGKMRVGIHQVEYSVGADTPVVHIFGRDASGKATQVRVTGFRPYFYVPADQVDGRSLPREIVDVDPNTDYRSIQDVPLRRLYTRRPGDVRAVRDDFKQHYEADIPFTTRFMIDRGLTGGVELPADAVALPDGAFEVEYSDLAPAEIKAPARTCIMDIECVDEEGFPEPERDPIICVTCWDSFDGDYLTLLWQPGAAAGDVPDLSVNERHRVVRYPDEASMLRGLVAYTRERDPDILSGWNFVEFDIPYIVKRMAALGLPAEDLARIPGQTERNAVRGRSIFDLLGAYRKMHQAQKESYRLDAVAEEELGVTKVRYTGTITELWRSDPKRLVEYNCRDVELCVGIDQKNNIIEFYREIARYVGCPLDRTLNSSNVIDIYVLRKASGRFVLPSKGLAAGDEFEGATVFEPATGLRENVVVLDLKSLYPMAMMTINASPETKNPDGELRAPNGVRFSREPDGLTRSIIAELLEERDERKRLRNLYPFGSPEYVLYDLQQNVLKVIMNSYYGVSGYTRFRLYDREIGSAVTSVGRAIIRHTRDIITGLGYTVLYGDTDSCMVQVPPGNLEETIARARAIEAKLNASYGGFAKTELNADTHYFSIKFEKVYRRFFQAGKKKRYAGHLVWKEGKDVDEVDVVGFEIRRSDSPQITRGVQRAVIEMILRGDAFSDVQAYLRDVIRKYRRGEYSLDEAGIPGGIGKNLDSYENDDAHIRGAKYSNEHLGTDFKRGSKPKRVYIKNVTEKYPRTDVVCFEYADQVPPEFVVDWETMLEKTLKGPISRIIEPLGWDWHDVDPSRTTLFDFGM